MFAGAIMLLPIGRSLTVTKVNEFDLEHAAVSSIAPSYVGDGECTLLLTTFYPFGSDKCSIVNTPISNPTMQDIDVDAKWPNQANPLSDTDAQKLGMKRGILSASGFFVSPSKSTGAVTLYDTSDINNTTKTTISTSKKNYFYHHAEFADIDGDENTLDIVAARAYVSEFSRLRRGSTSSPAFFGKTDGELVWLQRNSVNDTWSETVLAKGPDVGFTSDDIDGDGKLEFIAAQYFTAPQLSVWWCDGENWADCASDQTLVRSNIIDNDSDLPFFNCEVADVNGDGKKDILATTNTANGKGSVLAYEIPTGQDWKQGSWPKHRIATGFKPTKAFLPGRGSPGTATAIYPTKNTSGKPLVMVGADDGGWVSLLTPLSTNTTDWTYSNKHIINSTGTIGSLSFGFCDEDDTLDFFVPLFAESKVATYTFKNDDFSAL